MFTPPPSPLPLPRIVISDDSDFSSSSSSLEKEPADYLSVPTQAEREREQSRSSLQDEKRHMQSLLAIRETADVAIASHERKARAGRRTRWAILLVPAVLMLVALTRASRYISLPLDDLDELDALDLGASRGDNASPISEPGVRWTEGGIDLEMDLSVGEQRHDHEMMRHHRRQAFSLADPAAPSSASLITTTTTSPSPSASDPDSASQTASPTTPLSQTQQTIPPVPDASNPPTLPTPFPQPFDTTGSSSNITTTSCANFFTNMTQTEPFRTCRPFSLLEQFSNEFIESQTNLTTLNTLLYGTCNTITPAETCISNMDWFATTLQSECSTEIKQNNEMVVQTLLGLQSYGILRSAACLENQVSNNYCYASAAHASSPADLYLYQLPLGIGWPSNVQPSCSSCAGSVLQLFAGAVKTGNSSMGGLGGEGGTYEAMAERATSVCGSGYAVVAPAAASGGARSSGVGAGTGVVVGVVLGLVGMMGWL